ncbi:MAG: SDR family oxidoreductase [Actinomycetota bacterium]|nr:SDR family oxidoreductase [Actinomycetota bacterium]
MTTEAPPPRVALVTGAASGIGAAVAGSLRDRGWRVAGLDLRESPTDLPLTADVADRAAVQAAADRTGRELGPVQALVTAAGVYAMSPVVDIGTDAWRRMLAVHLGGVANACWAVVPSMLTAGAGSIVTISSELAIAGGCRDAHYAAAKGAIIGFTRSLGAELAPRGIRVNSVAPGPTDTPLLEADSPWRAPDYLATLPLRRLVAPEEVAATVVFVLSEQANFAGQVLSPNAGAVI